MLLVSGGWTPSVHLFSQSRGKLIYRESDATFIPHKSFQEEISIGACNGTFELNDIFEEIYSKMTKILSEFGKNIDKKWKENSVKNIFHDKIKHLWIVPSDRHFGKTKMFVDFQNDVTAWNKQLLEK